MGSMWFTEVQSGSQGFLEVHLGYVRFNEVRGFFGVKWGSMGSMWFAEVQMWFAGVL